MSPKRVGFVEAIVLYFKNYVNFTGRSTRSEYWWIVLFNFIVTGILYTLGALAGINDPIRHTNILISIFKATPHISKKYRIQKKNTRQISRV